MEETYDSVVSDFRQAARDVCGDNNFQPIFPLDEAGKADMATVHRNGTIVVNTDERKDVFTMGPFGLVQETTRNNAPAEEAPASDETETPVSVIVWGTGGDVVGFIKEFFTKRIRTAR